MCHELHLFIFLKCTPLKLKFYKLFMIIEPYTFVWVFFIYILYFTSIEIENFDEYDEKE